MSEFEPHPRDELQLLLDGRLEDGRRAAVDAHLAACASCRDELATLRWLKRGLATPPEAPPDDLAARIHATLDAEDAAHARHDGRSRLWLAAAAAALVALALALFVARRPADLPERAAAELAAAEVGTVRFATDSPAELERRFAAANVGFEVHVFDLAASSLRLEGGSVGRFAGGASAVIVYRTADGARVVCVMYRGALADLPASRDVRHRDDGLEARLFRRDGTTLAFWQEGEVVCFFAAERLPADTLVDLAFAKAARA